MARPTRTAKSAKAPAKAAKAAKAPAKAPAKSAKAPAKATKAPAKALRRPTRLERTKSWSELTTLEEAAASEFMDALREHLVERGWALRGSGWRLVAPTDEDVSIRSGPGDVFVDIEFGGGSSLPYGRIKQGAEWLQRSGLTMELRGGVGGITVVASGGLDFGITETADGDAYMCDRPLPQAVRESEAMIRHWLQALPRVKVQMGASEPMEELDDLEDDRPFE